MFRKLQCALCDIYLMKTHHSSTWWYMSSHFTPDIRENWESFAGKCSPSLLKSSLGPFKWSYEGPILQKFLHHSGDFME
jgi:hypothetical protein